MKRTFIVDPSLPIARLGNMLLVWARARLFAELNALLMLAPTWSVPRLGPWLRGERYKRYYGNLFNSQGYVARPVNWVTNLGSPSYRHDEPEMKRLEFTAAEWAQLGQHRFIFHQLPHWSDYFKDLKDYQPLIKRELLSMTRSSVLAQIDRRPAPEIGLHIRMSDFRVADTETAFEQDRHARTPLHWFIGVLQMLRQLAGYDVSAIVFTDGHPHEVTDLLALPNVTLAGANSALSDMLTLSRSKVLIASSHSTFSAWASYLGQCPTVWHPAKSDWYQSVLSESVRSRVYEGGFEPGGTMPDLLIDNIRQLCWGSEVAAERNSVGTAKSNLCI